MSSKITDEQLEELEHQKRTEFILANTDTLSPADLAGVPNDQLADVFGETIRAERRTKRREILANSNHYSAAMLDDFDDEQLNEAHRRVVPAHESAIPRGDYQANVRQRTDAKAEKDKPLAERMRKHIAFGEANEDSPYDDDSASSTSPSANAAGRGDVGPSTGGGSFEGFLQANAEADPDGSDDVRDVRLVDDPTNGEHVRMIDSRTADDGAAAGAERVRIVDLETNAEAAVDADPVYVDNESASAGTFASYNAQPDTTLLPVNPEKLG